MLTTIQVIHHPAALEFYTAEFDHLDGTRGTNRAPVPSKMLQANNDLDAIKAWLAQYIQNPNTFSSYRKEAERLLLWANIEAGKAFSSLTHEDLLRFQHFLQDPQPVERWILPRGAKVARSHADWRPFVGPLSSSSIRQTVTILGSLFNWLVAAGYLTSNPLALLRGGHIVQSSGRIQRYLDRELWDQVKLCIAELPQNTKREREHYHRYRWMFSLLYLCGLRVTELSENHMESIYARRDKEGGVRWWIDIIGKGRKVRTVPITSELMDELKIYRTVKGLNPYPIANEHLPLILAIGKIKEKPLSRAAIHIMVKRIFAKTAARLRAKGPKYEAEAQHVEQASTHWMRHTAGTHMLEQNMDILQVRDTLGHQSIQTTNRYLHTSENSRHDATEKSHKIKW